MTTLGPLVHQLEFLIVLEQTTGVLFHGATTGATSNSSLFGLELSGVAQPPGSFSNVSQSLIASFGCDTSGSGMFTITLNLAESDLDPVTFGAKKSCGGVRSNVGVGTSSGLYDVVSDGVTDPLWQKNSNDQFILGPADTTVIFYIQMMHIITNDTQILKSATTTSSNPDVDVLVLQISTPISLNSSAPVILTTTTANCNLVGTVQFEVSLNFDGGFFSSSFYFSKKCGSA